MMQKMCGYANVFKKYIIKTIFKGKSGLTVCQLNNLLDTHKENQI